MRKSVYVICEQQRRNQPSHPRSLISAFVVHCLDRIIPILANFKITRLKLASEAAQNSLSLTWSETTKDKFYRDRLKSSKEKMNR